MPNFIEKKIEQALQEGEQIGLMKGRQEGQRLTQIKNIKLTLAIRFEMALERYDKLLNELSLPQLEELLRVALQAQEVSEFDAVLDDLMAKDSSDSEGE